MTAMAFSAICYPHHFSFFWRPRANNNTGRPFKLCDQMLVKIYKKKYELIDRYAISWNAANVIHWYAILLQTLCVVSAKMVHFSVLSAFAWRLTGVDIQGKKAWFWTGPAPRRFSARILHHIVSKPRTTQDKYLVFFLVPSNGNPSAKTRRAGAKQSP